MILSTRIDASLRIAMLCRSEVIDPSIDALDDRRPGTMISVGAPVPRSGAGAGLSERGAASIADRGRSSVHGDPRARLRG
jgi:hypothetical protein